MFLAHLPAGYLCGIQLRDRFPGSGLSAKAIMLTALAGGLAPDLDLFYFYLIDQRQTHHHLYWPHFPLLWAALAALAMGWYRWVRPQAAAALACVFSVSALVHTALDTVVGDIHWLAPFLYGPLSLFTVPARYQPWWLNFLLHWTIVFEFAVVLAAVFVFYERRLKLRSVPA